MQPYRITQRKGSPYWWYSFTVNGVRFRGSTKTSEKTKANEIALNIYSTVFDSVKLNKKPRITVEGIFVKYYEEEACFRKSERMIYIHLGKLKDFFGATTYWDLIDDNFVARYVAQRRNSNVYTTKNYKDGRKKLFKTNRKISNATINHELKVLSRVCTLCNEIFGYQQATFNIRKHILEQKEGNKSFFSMEMAQKIAANLPLPHRWAFLLACYAGVRKTNALELRKDQINRVDGYITFRVKSSRPEGKIVTSPIITPLEDMFCAMEKSGISFSGNGYLFTYSSGPNKGKPLGDIRKSLYSAYERAGYDRKIGEGFHITRHSVATWLVNSGVDMELAQQVLGHSNITTTQLYAHRKTDSKKQALEKVLSQNWRNEETNGS